MDTNGIRFYHRMANKNASNVAAKWVNTVFSNGIKMNRLIFSFNLLFSQDSVIKCDRKRCARSTCNKNVAKNRQNALTSSQQQQTNGNQSHDDCCSAQCRRARRHQNQKQRQHHHGHHPKHDRHQRMMTATAATSSNSRSWMPHTGVHIVLKSI